MFYIGFLFFKNERFAHSLTFGELCEQITQVTHQKMSDVIESLGYSPKMSDHECDLLRSLTKNERMSESLVFLSESLIS